MVKQKKNLTKQILNFNFYLHLVIGIKQILCSSVGVL